MNRVLVQLTVVSILAAAAAPGSKLRVCLEDRAEVSVAARAELVLELIRLFPGAGMADPSRCARQDDGVRVRLTREDLHHPVDALGAIEVQGDGVIAPPVLVFVDAVERYSGASGERALGRALARVAGHELLHYLRQSQHHRSDGLMQKRLSSLDLTRNSGPPAWTGQRRESSFGH